MVKPVFLIQAILEQRKPRVEKLRTPRNLVPGRHPHEVDGHAGLGQRKDQKPKANPGKPKNRAYDVGGVRPKVREADSAGAHHRYGSGRWTDKLQGAPNAYDAQPLGNTDLNQLVEEPGQDDESSEDRRWYPVGKGPEKSGAAWEPALINREKDRTDLRQQNSGNLFHPDTKDATRIVKMYDRLSKRLGGDHHLSTPERGEYYAAKEKLGLKEATGNFGKGPFKVIMIMNDWGHRQWHDYYKFYMGYINKKGEGPQSVVDMISRNFESNPAENPGKVRQINVPMGSKTFKDKYGYVLVWNAKYIALYRDMSNSSFKEEGSDWLDEDARAGAVGGGAIAGTAGAMGGKNVGALFGGTMMKREPTQEAFGTNMESNVAADLRNAGWSEYRKGAFINLRYPNVYAGIHAGKLVARKPGDTPFEGTFPQFEMWLQLVSESYMHDPDWGVQADLTRQDAHLANAGWIQQGRSLYYNNDFPGVWIKVNGDQVEVEGEGADPEFRGSIMEFQNWLQQTFGRGGPKKRPFESKVGKTMKIKINESAMRMVSEFMMKIAGPKWGRELYRKLQADRPDLYKKLVDMFGKILRQTRGVSMVRDKTAWDALRGNPEAFRLARELQTWAEPILHDNEPAQAWMNKKAGKLPGAVPMGLAGQDEKPEEDEFTESADYTKRSEVARSVRVRSEQPDQTNPTAEVGKPGLNKEFNQARSVPVAKLAKNLKEMQALLGKRLTLALFEADPLDIPDFLKRYKDTDPKPWEPGGAFEKNPMPNKRELTMPKHHISMHNPKSSASITPTEGKPPYRANPAEADVDAPLPKKFGGRDEGDLDRGEL